jgi:hypothetical protein
VQPLDPFIRRGSREFAGRRAISQLITFPYEHGGVVPVIRETILACALVLSCGCASTGFLMAKPKVTMFGPTYPAKDSTATIEVFQSQKPDRPYQEIARIEVGDTDDNWSMKHIILQARQIGADAVIIAGRVGTVGVATPIGSQVHGASRAYGLTAVAIRFRPGS